jgi:hypothetical protein
MKTFLGFPALSHCRRRRNNNSTSLFSTVLFFSFLAAASVGRIENELVISTLFLPFSTGIYEMPLCVYIRNFSSSSSFSVLDLSRFRMHIQSVVTQSHVGRRREFIFSGKRRRGEKVKNKKEEKIVRMEQAAAT